MSSSGTYIGREDFDGRTALGPAVQREVNTGVQMLDGELASRVGLGERPLEHANALRVRSQNPVFNVFQAEDLAVDKVT